MGDHYRNAVMLLRDGRFEEAAAELETLLREPGAPPAAYEKLTDVYKLSLRLEEGERFFRRLLIERPEDAWAMIELARLRFLEALPLNAMRLLSSAEKLFRRADNREGVAYVRYYRLFINVLTGDLSDAFEELVAIREEFKALGDDRGAARTRALAGSLREFLGDCEGARREILEAIPAAERMGDLDRVAGLYLDLGNCFLRNEELPRAREAFEKARSLAGQIQGRLLQVYGMKSMADLLRAEGDAAGARDELDRALALVRECWFDYGRCDLLLGLGPLYLETGETSGAISALEEARRIARAINDMALTLLATRDLGRALVSAARPDEAVPILREGIGALEDAILSLTDPRMRQALLEEHAELVEDARELFRKMGLSGDLQALERLTGAGAETPRD